MPPKSKKAKGRKAKRGARKGAVQVVNLQTSKRRRTKKGKRRGARMAGPTLNRPSGPGVSTRTFQRNSRDGHMCRFVGTDFLTAVTAPITTGYAAGSVVYTKIVNPAVLGVSRLATVSKLWERYKFKRLTFEYEPIANAQLSGSLVGYVDYDTYDDPTGLTGDQNIQRADAHFGNKATKLWEGAKWEIRDIDPLTDLYIDSDDSDPRWTNQGRFVLIANSAINVGGATAMPLGTIKIHYDIEFYIPQLELSPTTGYGYRLVGATSMTQAAIWGTEPVQAGWTNVPITYAANVFTLPAGTWLVTGRVTGTVLALTKATTATIIDSADYKLTGSDGWMFQYQVTSSAAFTITIGGTATTVTGSFFYAALLPADAVTMTQRRLNKIERMLQLCGEVKAMQRTLSQLTSQEPQPEGKEAKECKSYVYSASSSGSVVSAFPSLRQSSSAVSEDDYFVVAKRNAGGPRP